MAHKAQRDFVEKVKRSFPLFFFNSSVIDIGSRDVNGTNRDHFHNCEYVGIDVTEGPNVDVVMPGHEYDSDPVDVTISTECFEHDMFWDKTIRNMIRLTKNGGLFIFTCASDGRPEHGTRASSEGEEHWDQALWPDYYMNLNEAHIRQAINVDKTFSSYGFVVNGSDLYFFGVKGPNNVAN